MHKDSKMMGELVYGVHPVIELLKAKKRKILALYTTKPTPKAWDQIQELLPKYPVAVNYVSKDALSNMAGTTDHQGIVGYAAPFVYRSKPFDAQKQKFLLMLDGIQDTRNLGAILRSAYCTGVQGVIITKKNSVSLSAPALKASAGLAEHLEIYLTNSAQSGAQELLAAGYTLYVTAFKGEPASKANFKSPLCVVIGSEGLGVTPAIIKMGTQITLEQRSPDISYNASVAAGILLYMVGTQQNYI